MEYLDQVLPCLPSHIRCQLQGLDKQIIEEIEEIRIYCGKQTQVIAGHKTISLTEKVSPVEINDILNQLMQYSYYAYEEDLSKGFITIKGGHRVGICGKAVIERGKTTLLRDISSLNIRCAREIIGCSDAVMKQIFSPQIKLSNVLIVSPPGCGKTTLLRDIARHLSERGIKVAICDERSEIAAMSGGYSNYHFGPMVDVLDGCPKETGIMMLIRSMSPQVIIVDEIGKSEDMEAIKTCVHCGVHLITTIHGCDLQDLQKSEIYPAIAKQSFQHIIILTDHPKAGTIKEIIHV